MTATKNTAAKNNNAKAEKNGKAEKAEPKAKALYTPNQGKVMKALSKAKHPMTAAQLVKATGVVKGKRLPQLVEAGYVSTLVAEEGTRGQRYQLTPAGRKVLS